jgi:nifR3 family TIM-barrel protein
MIQEKSIQIGQNLTIQNLLLAPMDGFTDHPFRMISKKLGAGAIVSEFINGWDIVSNHPFLEQKIFFTDFERPFAYQIFDDSPERILKAAQFLEQRSPDFIDINCGCSAKSVANRGAGAGLLRSPLKIGKIIALLVKNINVPITAKIRLGWDETQLNYLETSKIIEEEGGSMITVHGRTKKQGYSGKANWDAIAEVKAARTIPVIANGDVQTKADLEAIQTVTNCDGVMIGRGALTNPWIFQNRDVDEVSYEEKYTLFRDHFNSILDFYGHTTGMVLFRKHLRSYIFIDQLDRLQRIELFHPKDEKHFLSLVQGYMESGLIRQPVRIQP